MTAGQIVFCSLNSMAYLHCHACSWSQDDFWHRRYNPLTRLKTVLKYWGRPRMVHLDSAYICHSWRMLGREIRAILTSAWRMKYWTEPRWKKRGESRWICPRCGAKKLDVD